jgi:HK97 family phage major capsid protein
MNLEQILARMGELRSELEELGNVEVPSDEQTARFAEAMDEYRGLRSQKETIEERARQMEEIRRDEVRKAADRPEARLEGDGAINKNVNVQRTADDIYETRSLPNLRMNLSVSEKADAVRQYQDRARRAVESSRFAEDRHAESAMHIVDQDGTGGISAHILRTGSPVYRSAFSKYLQDPRGLTGASEEERAALSLTGANGGYLVPFTLDPTVILTNDGATNPFRGIATVKSITTDDWNGVSSAGVTAEWLAQATEAADASPTFAQPSITPAKAAAYIQASFEVMADSGVVGELGMLIADAKARLEAAAFATGTGTGQPQGIVTALQLVTASRVAGSSGAAGAADFVVGDIYALANALPPRFRPGSSWMGEQSTLNRIRQFATGSGPQHAFWADLGMNVPAQLLGRPVYESSAMDSTIVSGSNDDVLVLGDFKNYYIVDRVGLTLAYEPLVKGSSFRPTGEAGWFAYWRVGGKDVSGGAAFRMLRV